MTIVSAAPQLTPRPLPEDYLEKVYAGILGKLIGVYLGRPIEGWTYQRISAELGDVQYYLHHRLGVPLVVTDDDITGTFTFLRALEEQECSPDFTAADVGVTWLNAILEGRTILWWGGYGMSTEHTAYLNLKNGVDAPRSGSAAQNGETVAEQIGAQIFVDGWAMVAPADPQRAATFAERAARVSHDGEAVYAAQALAAMEAQAFTTNSIPMLLDTALSLIPPHSLIARIIHDLKGVHAAERDWRRAREYIEANYGYDRYPGNCHVVPNHALILLALLYGEGDFQRSMMIVNTCGWDTDCNAGNLGCLLGIMNGLGGLEAGPDWRGPLADQLYLPTAEGGRAITDAVREAVWVANMGRALQDQPPVVFKDGARFHFGLPGSVQGFRTADGSDTHGTATLRNVAGHSTQGERSLEIHYQGLAPGRSARVVTPTFSPPEALAFSKTGAYELIASPTLYPGQRLIAHIEASSANAAPVMVSLIIQSFDALDQPIQQSSSRQQLSPGQRLELEWTVPDLSGSPVAATGVQVDACGGARTDGMVYLDSLTWTGMPSIILTKPIGGGTLWRQAWVNGVDIVAERWGEAFRLIQNQGRGLVSQGTRDWTDYRASAAVKAELSVASGLGVRVQGLRRYYALLLVKGAVQLVKVTGTEQVLAEIPFEWTFGETHHLALEVSGTRLRGWVNDTLVADVDDHHQPLRGGAVALLIEQGMLTCDAVKVEPV